MFEHNTRIYYSPSRRYSGTIDGEPFQFVDGTWFVNIKGLDLNYKEEHGCDSVQNVPLDQISILDREDDKQPSFAEGRKTAMEIKPSIRHYRCDACKSGCSVIFYVPDKRSSVKVAGHPPSGMPCVGVEHNWSLQQECEDVSEVVEQL